MLCQNAHINKKRLPISKQALSDGRPMTFLVPVKLKEQNSYCERQFEPSSTLIENLVLCGS